MQMYDFANSFLSTLNGNVEIKRELRYCGGFKCKTIHFMPQVRLKKIKICPILFTVLCTGCLKNNNRSSLSF